MQDHRHTIVYGGYVELKICVKERQGGKAMPDRFQDATEYRDLVSPADTVSTCPIWRLFGHVALFLYS